VIKDWLRFIFVYQHSRLSTSVFRLYRMPNVSRLKALTLDVTNTLVKARASIGQQYANAALAHGIQADPAALETAFNATWTQKKNEMPDYGRHHGVTSREWWSDLVKRVFVKAGHKDICPEMMNRVFDTLWDHFMVCSISSGD